MSLEISRRAVVGLGFAGIGGLAVIGLMRRVSCSKNPNFVSPPDGDRVPAKELDVRFPSSLVLNLKPQVPASRLIPLQNTPNYLGWMSALTPGDPDFGHARRATKWKSERFFLARDINLSGEGVFSPPEVENGNIHVASISWDPNNSSRYLVIGAMPTTTPYGGLLCLGARTQEVHPTPVIAEAFPRLISGFRLDEQKTPDKEELAQRLQVIFPPPGSFLGITQYPFWKTEAVVVSSDMTLGEVRQRAKNKHRMLDANEIFTQSYVRDGKIWCEGVDLENAPLYYSPLGLRDGFVEAGEDGIVILTGMAFTGDRIRIPRIPYGTRLKVLQMAFLSDPGNLSPSEVTLDRLNTNSGWPVFVARIEEMPGDYQGLKDRVGVSPFDFRTMELLSGRPDLANNFIPEIAQVGQTVIIPGQNLVPLDDSTFWAWDRSYFD